MEDARLEDAKAEAAGIEDARVEGPGLEEARAEDLEEIDTIIAELEVSGGRGNLILCVVNAPAYRDGIIRALSGRFEAKVIPVEEGEDVIQSLKSGDFGGAEVLIWTMPEKLTEDLADALNNFRELFYDAGVPSLVFSSQSFLDDVIRRAPDFWRYRGNYHELKGLDRGVAFEAIEALSTSLHYQSEADLLRRKRINEHLLEKVKDEKEITKILDELAQISYLLGDYDKASNYSKQELKISTEISYKEGVAKSLHQLGRLAQATGDLGEARRLYGDSLKIAQDLGDKSGISRSLHHLGILVQDAGDIAEARRLYGDSLKIAQDLGDKGGVASSLHHLGMLAQNTGDLADARRLYGESLKIKQELGDKSGVEKSLHQMGMLAQKTGDMSEARRLYGESLKIAQELGDKASVAITSAQTAFLEEHEGNLEKALDLIRQAETLFQGLGSPMAIKARMGRERLEKKIAK
ncbi:tetratricopeptide repeat protein [Candidatus Methanocrinis natronophilus]|uniref:Tetratricopeptide repeat protein n=1 Tax=Candidatus Methanocrinis natronophilus TaxID=3033396 RepID=A0ABT5X7T9_9EURY|nr:tetratricopeptide repeat protein [Candidatus Methanocrinis natronophilus]MDF0590760.1 tetratricopeptide repeat protein [Candidatus Methanocrinis natronophilus]